MAFNSINRQFRTVSEFSAWLFGSQPRPAWGVQGSTYHNTYKPTEAEWLGLLTMQSMQAHYVSLGWTAGPHLFLALHSPNPANDGIWVMTPLTSQGVHGVTCNPTHFGAEVVGDFQSKAPSAAQQQLLIDTLAVAHSWAGLGPSLNAHRDCVQRTCPGDAFYALKSNLQQRLAAALASDPLRARQLQGPPPAGKPVYCSVAAANFYAARGGLTYCGYPLRDEFRDASKACTVLPCERVIIKTSAAFGVEQALLSEARVEGWLL